MKKILKLLLLVILILFILFQFYPKANNNSHTSLSVKDITVVHQTPRDVQKILKTSCYDCHSNNTVYPWYAKIQPVSLWLANHIKDGKAELNFSEFGIYSLRKQFKKLEEINEQVKTNEMPLNSYTLIHKDAKLNPDQKLLLAKWVVSLKDSFTANYPPDSLRRKR